MKPVPILITWDVDPDLWIALEKRQKALHTALDLCQQQGIRATFFITAQGAEAYQDEFRAWQARGHEIGCHGLTHGNEENYDRMPANIQRTYIQEASEILRHLTGAPVRTFRGPRVKTSAHTLALLAEHGYLADSSVCSQRLDMVSSNLINLGWLFAPRQPYHPHPANAFKKGDLPLWEMPISAMIMPFISTSLRVFGLGVMKALFRLLYYEARRTGQPIVYLAHPTEFLGGPNVDNWRNWREFVHPKYLTPSFIRANGFRPRNLFYRASGQKLVDYTRRLMTFMASFPQVEFMTIEEYRAKYLDTGDN